MAFSNFAIAFSVVLGALFVLAKISTALPMKGVIGQAMTAAKAEQQRQKRDVTETLCEQPSNLEEMFQQLNSKYNKTSFLQSIPSGKAISNPSGSGAQILEGDPNESKECPSSLTQLSTAPLAHRSLCPYYFNILQLPRGYYPSTLPFAQCKCQLCVENTGYNCEAVTTRIAVLKPVGCFQGMQQYQEELVSIDTACACAVRGSNSN